jgi:hypothetical protein
MDLYSVILNDIWAFSIVSSEVADRSRLKLSVSGSMKEEGSCLSRRPTLSIAGLSLLCPFNDPAKMERILFLRWIENFVWNF